LSRVALVCVAAVFAFAFAARANAQSLQRLSVESFELSADTGRPQVDTPFHLIVTLRVRERVSEITNLELPMLAQLELLGDERVITSDARGSHYREVITVVAHDTGAIAIAPATLQAIDARDHRPKQWYTNDLRLSVIPSSARIVSNLRSTFVHIALIAGSVLAIAVLLGLAVLALRGALSRPRVVAPVAQVVVPPPAQRSLRQQIEDALVVLKADPTRATAVRVRAAIWRTIGAPEGETLADVLRRPGSNDPPLRDVLIALERSAFTYDADLQPAIEDACGALDRYAGSLV
jgi:hypothetical protein